jgi:hypothetical protein
MTFPEIEDGENGENGEDGRRQGIMRHQIRAKNGLSLQYYGIIAFVCMVVLISRRFTRTLRRGMKWI